MNAPANLLAVSPAIRATRVDWMIVQQKRIAAGYAWEPEAQARVMASVQQPISAIQAESLDETPASEGQFPIGRACSPRGRGFSNKESPK